MLGRTLNSEEQKLKFGKAKPRGGCFNSILFEYLQAALREGSQTNCLFWTSCRKRHEARSAAQRQILSNLPPSKVMSEIPPEKELHQCTIERDDLGLWKITALNSEESFRWWQWRFALTTQRRLSESSRSAVWVWEREDAARSKTVCPHDPLFWATVYPNLT